MRYLILFALAITSMFSYAQKRQMQEVNPEERAQEKVDRLDQELNLSDEQKKELNTYFVEAQKETKKIRKKQVKRRKAAREKREQLETQRAEIRKVRKN
ncbi:MAG: hypothetical protein R6V37_04950, partial [Psychroflexus maritimus]